jgi:hypothetical protein
MKNGRLFIFLAFSVVLSVLVVSGGCAGAQTVTLPGNTVTLPGSTVTVTPPAVTLPGSTVTLPGSTTTVPPTTITLPGSTTTLPGKTVTIPTIITVLPVTTVVPGSLLPDTPPTIVTHKSAIESLMGACLSCHGDGEYHQYPEAPFWDGGQFMSSLHPGGYFVIEGSIQDHTGRTADLCLGCHPVG